MQPSHSWPLSLEHLLIQTLGPIPVELPLRSVGNYNCCIGVGRHIAGQCRSTMKRTPLLSCRQESAPLSFALQLPPAQREQPSCAQNDSLLLRGNYPLPRNAIWRCMGGHRPPHFGFAIRLMQFCFCKRSATPTFAQAAGADDAAGRSAYRSNSSRRVRDGPPRLQKKRTPEEMPVRSIAD